MSPYWVEQLRTWSDNGTFDRIDLAQDEGRKVLVPRSDGSVSIGTIAGVGHAGRSITLSIDGGPPMHKRVRMERFLELNPSYGPSLTEMVPKHERDW